MRWRVASPRATSARLGEIDALLVEVLDRKSSADEARDLRAEALATFERVYGSEHPRTRAPSAQIATADHGP
jgi:hypothetical protein